LETALCVDDLDTAETFYRDPAGNSLELATPGVWGIEE
jgi:hypothetical protein